MLKRSKWLRGTGLMVLMMVLGVMIPALSLAQNGYDFSGFYYIANRDAGNYNATNAANNYYLCPSTNTYDRDMPFLTTYKTNQDNNSKWLVSFVRTENDIDYYTLYHLETQKYLTFNEQLVSGNADRVRVHLQSTMGADDRSLFYFTHAGGGFAQEDCYNIIPKGQNRSLNPAKNNYNFYEGVNQNSPGSFTDWQGITVYCGGLIGYYAANDTRGLWFLETCVVSPTLTPDASNQTVSISTSQSGATIYYTLDGSTPTSSSSSFSSPGDTVNIGPNRVVVNAIAYLDGVYSKVSTVAVDYRETQQISSLSEITNPHGIYLLVADVADASGHQTIQNFDGDFDGGFHTITGLQEPLFGTLDGGWREGNMITIRNVVLKDVNISGHEGNTGAIACEARGNVRIYNCGILSGSVGGTGDTGGLVGLLQPYLYTEEAPKYSSTFVVNCYSFANITQAGTYSAGIVGNNNYASTAQNFLSLQSELRTAVVNCIFYGDVLAGTNKYPVYGNQRLQNSTDGINNYDFFMNTASLDDDYPTTGTSPLNRYNCSWPVEERYLTRYEYYRSIFNSNRRLCVWWVTQKQFDSQTDEDLDLIAKWVLDPSIAPYPILKPWGKYPSVINQDPQRVWNTVTEQWVDRDDAEAYQGKKLDTLAVTVNAGSNNSGHSTKVTLPVLDMDTLNHDYGYAKVQLPYYNELFGDPDATTHAAKYGNNYTDKVVTGWMITSVTGGTPGTFVEDWESGYDFADRYCTNKDLYSVSKRVFAQGGYYYVPEGVTAITIEAYWGNAVYLHNAEHNMDRVNLGGNAFAPAGTLPATFNGQTVRTTIKNAIEQLDLEGNDAVTVYDQAIVLVGNYQYRNNGTVGDMGWSDENGSEAFSTHNRPYTFTSVDLDFDNEPDYCFEWQFSSGTTRLNLHPVRFDFLPVPALGMAIRTDAELQTIGVFAPRGHFEITETAFMHTGQFEYETRDNYRKKEAPLILNGGQFEQIVSSQTWNSSNGPLNKTTYIILGGHVWMKEFTPGKHGDLDAATRHCAVSVLGGEYNRLCLSGVFVKNSQNAVSTDNPHCYINGGKFGAIYGAGMEQINGNVTFMIDHSLIGEFYGGGLNAAKPITGNINVTINNSIVGKYCGGPFTGDMNENTTVTTVADNTIFGVFYGAGNGGTNYNRNRKFNASVVSADITESWWRSSSNGKFDDFTPLHYVGSDAGYEAQFEFELIDQSSSSQDQAICRTYCHEAQFTATEVRTVTSTLNNCEVLQDFYGAGNLGKVTGNVTSTLNNTTVWGSAYGGGFSAEVPSFPIHDKETVVFPKRDLARVNHPGSLDYVRDDGEIRYYKWIHDLPEGVSASTSSPAFQYDGKWYCYTEKSMSNLGAVEGNTTLTLQGNSMVRESIFGGGDESVVSGSTLVKVLDQTKVFGNIYGGGNKGRVGGDTKVIINGVTPQP